VSMEMVLTLVTNECECIESGECTCSPYLCLCECGCKDCTQEYVIVDDGVDEDAP